MDKKKYFLLGAIAVLLVASIVLVVRTKSSAIIKINPAFREYISAFTSGVISTESTIKIRLTDNYADSALFEKPIEDKLFSFSPSIEGKAYWIDAKTIEFRPANKLPAKKMYTASFYLSKIINVPDSMKTFKFQFTTMQQAMEVFVDNHKAYDKKNLKLEKITGFIRTADVAEMDKVQKVISATQDGKELKISWVSEKDRKEFGFQIDSVIRSEKDNSVLIKWDGEPIEADNKSELNVQIPSLNSFIMTGVKIVQTPEQCVLLQFSDPVKEDQDFTGLIKIGSLKDLKFMVDDNEIRVYTPSQVTKETELTIEPAITNNDGKKLDRQIITPIKFENIKPDVRLVGNGVILPSTNGMVFPFEAVNLRAVDVKIMRIYENNIAQFLQVNDLSGNRELSRVGRIILKKTIPLSTISSSVTDFTSWNRYFLDLSELIKAEPGAIYKITISFKKEYSLYDCSGENTANTNDEMLSTFDKSGDEDQDWDYYNDYYGYDYEDYEYYYYDWNQRDNPCDNAYYRNKVVSRNILATDIALIAKSGNNGELKIFASNLLTTEPMPGVEIEVYDYQNQILAKMKTDGEGLAQYTIKRIPYLVIAKSGKQRAYLKLNGGSSLSMSMFDVGGEAVKKGIKGFIYGERGVWRPGDSIFLTFILEDKLKTLPKEIPVIFDLSNPKGQKIKHVVKTNSVNGFYDFRTATDANAITGNYTAEIKVGGSVFSKTLKVETIKPNRLKIILDFGADRIFKSENKKGKLDVKWLHGAIARNLKTDVTMVLNRSTTAFNKYPGYIFDDPSKKFSSETYNIFTGKLDNEGKAEVDPSISLEKAAPGVLKASFETRVFEEGGEFSVDRFSLPYYPYKTYVGVAVPEGTVIKEILETGKNYAFRFVNLDAYGKLVPSGKIKVDIYKISWRWWWDSDNELSDFVRSSYNEPYLTKELNTVGGQAQLNFKVENADWGRYLVKVTDLESGHSAGRVVYIDWPNWASRSRDGKEAASMLVFTSDKPSYKVGEEVKLTIPSSEGGRALITVESGSKVINHYWVPTDAGETKFSFKVTEEMSPNVYAYVTLLQPHNQTANDLPIRLYGIIPIKVEDPNTHLKPKIIMPDVLRPEENATITVKEENGKNMTFTLAVVDEGLLDLTNFKTPQPWDYFYAREALGVKTWDLYDLVIGAYGGKLERILSLGGGDDGSGGKGKNRANRFKPMVKFFGPIALKKGEIKNLKFKVPQYVGSVRVMVVAGQDGAYGNAEKTVAVKKPLMLLATLPRVVGPGEIVKLPVSVFATEKKIKNVSLKITTNELFTVDDQSTKNISFTQTGDQLVTFNLKVKQDVGVGKVKVYAVSGNETAVYEIEIDVRNPNPPMTEVTETIIKGGGTWNTSFVPIGIKGTNSGTIELSSIPPINLEKRLNYLVAYPYGCIEQTTSSVFPQLYLSELIDLDATTKANVERNIKAGINRIGGFQTSSGGFSYWPGQSEADEWGSCYAGHFLLEAKAKGYTVSANLISNWVKYQKRKANSWTSTYMNFYYFSDLLQSYRLYTLALAKSPDLGAMNLLRENKNLSDQAKWRLAAAYQLAGQTNAAKQLALSAATSIKPYREMHYCYGSDLRDKAMIVETMCLLDMKLKAAPLIKQISESLNKDYWLSTQETAYCLLSISKFVANSGGSTGINISYSMNGSADISKISKRSVALIDMNLKGSNAKGKIKVKNLGKGLLYAKLVLKGTPEAGQEKAAQNNLKIDILYKDLKGGKIDPVKLEQGTDFIAEVTVTNTGLSGNYFNMVLSNIFPSGWEIHNTRMDNYTGRVEMAAYNYQDFRDDRVYIFFDINSKSKKTYNILLNASYLGKFYLPSVVCEAMYDNSIYARTVGKWVEVIPYNEKTTAKK